MPKVGTIMCTFLALEARLLFLSTTSLDFTQMLSKWQIFWLAQVLDWLTNSSNFIDYSYRIKGFAVYVPDFFRGKPCPTSPFPPAGGWPEVFNTSIKCIHTAYNFFVTVDGLDSLVDLHRKDQAS